MEDLRVAIFCDEYDKQYQICRDSSSRDSVRAAEAMISMGVNRRAIEGEVDDAMLLVRMPENRLVSTADRATYTIAYFSAWLSRRGGWE